MIAITFALPAESSGVVGSLRERKTENRVIYGKLSAREVAIFHTGVGRKACQPNIEHFLSVVRPTVLISTGFAGGVNQDLRPGDLIAAENYSDPALINYLEQVLYGTRMQKARLFTASSLVDSAEERNQIARNSAASAVDMETEVIAQACATRNIRMLSLRAISDTPTAPFPVPPSVLFDVNRQAISFTRLGWHIVRHPAAVSRLIRFSRQVDKARKELTGEIIPWVYVLGHPQESPLHAKA
jgi:nucleoside phosphorylase